MRENMKRRLFCEISPLTYRLSVLRCQVKRYLIWIVRKKHYAKEINDDKLPLQVISHQSLIRRTLGDVDRMLQDNKATNLRIAAEKVNHIIIRPQETFSFWRLVGRCTKRKGYKDGLIVEKNALKSGTGGGMCQFTNLIHWMVLHSPLTITEHHHHDSLDLFPDHQRKVPFGMGTSIMYNYLDYQFTNNTDNTFQIIVYMNEVYLCGELRCLHELSHHYRTIEEEHYFSHENDGYYRNNKVYRETINNQTGIVENRELLKSAHAKVMYDSEFIPKELIT